jgi:LacI family transcriptional regulator
MDHLGAAVTIKEIAAKAGYSHAVVSSVLNGRAVERRISQNAARKVEDAARELGYVPNMAARRLRSHESGTSQAVLAIITSFEAPLLLVSRAVRALQRCIEQTGGSRTQFTITIEMFRAGRLSELPGLLTNDRFNGAIIANTIEADDHFLEHARVPFPAVLIGRVVPGYASVLESAETGEAAARLLLESGCKRCAILAPALPTAVNLARAGHFAEALREAGRLSPIELKCSDRSERAGYEAMHAHLASAHRSDGFFAITDTLAAGAYHAVREAGLTIPGDLCFVGVGDSESSPYLGPPLACVGSSEEAIHLEAARWLLQCFSGGGTLRVPVRLPLQIFPGGSTRLIPF